MRRPRGYHPILVVAVDTEEVQLLQPFAAITTPPCGAAGRRTPTSR
jgi:hypothetical protein